MTLSISKKTFYFCIIFTSFFSSINAQKLKFGPQVLTFHSNVDDTDQPYSIYIPRNFSAKKKYPLVVMLHGAGSNHRLAMRRVFGKSNTNGETDVEASLYFPKWKDVDYIVVAPNARGTMGYQGVAEKDVWDMLANVKKRFKIDENRIYLTGLSMGGGGTMWIGLTRPDVWAAIAPVCPAPPMEIEKYMENGSNLPMYFFQGAEDPVVLAENTRKMVNALKNSGAKVMYQEYPGVKHNSWENAYKDEFIFNWFDKQKRNPYPDKVKFTTQQLKYNKAYWVEIVEQLNTDAAKIEANFKGKNMMDIKTSNIKSFKLDIIDHPNFNTKKQLMLNIDGQNLPIFGLLNGQMVTKNGDKWVVKKQELNANQKNSVTEGPLSEVVSDRQIYVYGTEGNPTKEEQEARQKMAETAADWSHYRGDFMGRVMVFPRILSDKEVRSSDIERSNLILFGNKKTNSLIAKYADKLPIELKEENEKNTSLSLIYPNGKRYIVVNSGLPFWEMPEISTGPYESLKASSKAGVFAGYGDWTLYDKELNNVISSSKFDLNWKLTEKDAEVLKKTNKVILK
jgi:dipeptidyl aminopeptidase/acylaminoacyl peptidase